MILCRKLYKLLQTGVCMLAAAVCCTHLHSLTTSLAGMNGVRQPVLHANHLIKLQSLTVCRELVGSIAKSPAGVLVTSYEQLRLQRDELLHVPWGYAILDEGHKIRNPDAEVG